ncbi:hypothetical protein Clacol_001757 [Clathrus columnatus]|uniref:Uncharacterized protein n=1 Tax=Clathrus columnatus TaxID=1419009 RepID=A0AAV5A6L6_9AGAM|nr:hypothetical protein Clacol_001757 [Clathrus columnatus]
MNELKDEEMESYLEFCERALLTQKKVDKSAVPEPYSTVLGVSSRLVGIGLEEMGAVVERFEKRLVRFYGRDPE